MVYPFKFSKKQFDRCLFFLTNDDDDETRRKTRSNENCKIIIWKILIGTHAHRLEVLRSPSFSVFLLRYRFEYI